MAKTETISVRVLPGRVLTHDGEHLEAGEVFDLTEAQAQAQALLAAGHVERVAIEAEAEAEAEATGAIDDEPTKDPEK